MFNWFLILIYVSEWKSFSWKYFKLRYFVIFLCNFVLFDFFEIIMINFCIKINNNHYEVLMKFFYFYHLESAYLNVILQLWVVTWCCFLQALLIWALCFKLHRCFLNVIVLSDFLLLETALSCCWVTFSAVFTLCWHVMTLIFWFDIAHDDLANMI